MKVSPWVGDVRTRSCQPLFRLAQFGLDSIQFIQGFLKFTISIGLQTSSCDRGWVSNQNTCIAQSNNVTVQLKLCSTTHVQWISLRFQIVPPLPSPSPIISSLPSSSSSSYSYRSLHATVYLRVMIALFLNSDTKNYSQTKTGSYFHYLQNEYNFLNMILKVQCLMGGSRWLSHLGIALAPKGHRSKPHFWHCVFSLGKLFTPIAPAVMHSGWHYVSLSLFLRETRKQITHLVLIKFFCYVLTTKSY